ncbi:peptidoglycan/xylan/chitin deacetylase (PgdA/CDA1 family) [Kitasatospora gansuensis]|uniref:Peptidoglycan/xylan/chitin deacetylase (PgdA/CDA1 family) n=1 Tax=Kitasatospora gansuensis TaxID=258050 RepID=A0A7W7WFV2_9ACTN|nr:polysaccharide deacetylase family protein [Kitasatospora gansuensis]MBB4945571.1 peptidoglycan/xylan/chitin deacetylase (PgdA/CDA1 family) [Kitasatospora gansuensis]
MTAVPVFLYHSVSDDPPPWIAPFAVTPRAFAEQLDRIADAGRTIVPLHRLVAAIRGGPALPASSAVLTFDDGFADFYWTVAQLLTERGLPATLFVTTGAIHPPGGVAAGSLLPPAPMLSWRQVVTLDACGVEIGAHTRTHPQLDTLPSRWLASELVGCRQELEDVIGHPVTSFAYPHGYSSATVRRQVAQAGFSSACAVVNAFSSGNDEPLRIARLMVRADTTAEKFRSWTRGEGAPVAPLPEHLRTKGWRLYRRARAAVGSPVGGPPEI